MVRGRSSPLRADPERVVRRLDLDAGLAQLVGERFEVQRAGARHLDFAAGEGGGDRVGAGLEAVGDDLVLAAAEAFDALDLDGVRAVATDARAHADEHLGGALHFGFGGGVHDACAAARGNGGEHEVLRAENARVVGEDGRAFERLLRAGDELVAVAGDFRAEGGEAGEVDVDRALADDVAAGLRAGSLAEAAEERAHHEEAAAQAARGLHRGRGAVQLRGVDAQDVRRRPLDGRAEAAQDLRHLLDVADVGDVLEDALFGDEKGGGHRAEGGVLGAADADGAFEGAAAFDDEGAVALAHDYCQERTGKWEMRS